MDAIKDRNGMDLREAEDIKKRQQEYKKKKKTIPKKKLYKKITQMTTMVWSLT